MKKGSTPIAHTKTDNPKRSAAMTAFRFDPTHDRFCHLLREKTLYAKGRGQPEWSLALLAGELDTLGYFLSLGTLDSYRRCTVNAPNPPPELAALLFRITGDTDILRFFERLLDCVFHPIPRDIHVGPGADLLRLTAENTREQAESVIALLEATEDGAITPDEACHVINELFNLIRSSYAIIDLVQKSVTLETKEV